MNRFIAVASHCRSCGDPLSGTERGAMTISPTKSPEAPSVAELADAAPAALAAKVESEQARDQRYVDMRQQRDEAEADRDAALAAKEAAETVTRVMESRWTTACELLAEMLARAERAEARIRAVEAEIIRETRGRPQHEAAWISTEVLMLALAAAPAPSEPQEATL